MSKPPKRKKINDMKSWHTTTSGNVGDYPCGFEEAIEEVDEAMDELEK